MNLEICGHRVLIRPDDIETKSKGGILLAIPESTLARREQAAQTTGTILKIGPMAWKAFDGKDPNWKPWAKVGDHVLYTQYGGKECRDPENENKKVIIVNDEDVLAVISD